MNIKKMILSVFAAAFLCALPSQSYAGEPPSIGMTMFLGIYAKCNGNDAYPFVELLKGASIPESELYPRNKSSYEVSECIYKFLKIPVRFPDSGKKNYYGKSKNALYENAKTPMELIATLDAMVEDGAFGIDSDVKKQLDQVYRDFDNDGARMKAVVQKTVEEKMGRTIDVPENNDSAGSANSASQDQGSVKPAKKKKYIYVPSK